MMKLYIDPGTGSMLFTIIIGVVATLAFSMKGFLLKLKYHFSAGSKESFEDKDKTIPIVIFCESKRYWNVFKPICDEFERRKIPVEYWTESLDDPCSEANYNYVVCRFIGEGNKAYAKLNMMNCRVCLSTTPGLDVYQWKKSRNTQWYVHIFHQIDDGTVYKMFGLDFYDAVLSPNKVAIEKMRKIEDIRGIAQKEFKIVGSTYMDSMLQRKQATKEFTKSEGITVLVAPSWGKHALLSKYGEAIISSLLNTGYNIIIRPHPQSFLSEKELMNRLQMRFPESDKLSWNRDDDNFDVLNRADIMISDFSGVVLDFAFIFSKPVIYAEDAFDKTPYDASWLDGNIWTLDVFPELGEKLEEKDIGNMKACIDTVLQNNRYLQGIEYVKEQGWMNIGKAAESVVDYLVEKEMALRGNIK